MSADNDMPYDKAIEETAKAAGKALDVVRDVSPAISNVYGLLIGDRIAAAREKNLDEISRKTKKILEDRGVTERSAAPEQITIPLLEAAQSESREGLQTLWARLLANAIDPQRSEVVRPEFIKLVQMLEPLDARLLEYLHTKPQELNPQKHQVYEALHCRPSAAVVSVDHLVVDMKCIRLIGGGGVLALTEIGIELMNAVQA